MSFSGEVKKELVGIVPEARHCQIAEIAAFADTLEGEHGTGDGNGCFAFRTERSGIDGLLFTLFQRAFNMGINAFRETEPSAKGRHFVTIRTADPVRSSKARKAISHSSVLKLECCRRSYLRGAFLACGSVSDPEKSYHLEFSVHGAEAAEKIRQVLKREGFDARIVSRKKDCVVYLKEGDQIVELLGEMGASVSFLNLESVRVMKQMRGDVNRKVNCETANLDRTVNSAVKQIEDIRLIRDKRGFGDLTPALREMAEVRLEHPDASLSELGNWLDPKIGKSGVNHRLRKLSAYAEKLRLE